ncbi:hypothetical protein QYE76_069290 [Lolium multiflorum]|uniref:Transposase (putative) gypsy type domain-containing protein n=1 Tax=Lolium multiflorum TaxID=4521 RepID=A0AAD8WDC8_LOLMU|nr:hypothetical protein QYE76_069290 [Lolium multiflorum]
MATANLGSAEWERSKISAQDINLLKKMGFSKKENSLRFPKEESYPKPPIEYRVSFVDHLIRGFSPPIHEFLRGLLFVYGLKLHQLTPNSILHVSIFITLRECFLGVQPNWALWKRIFCLRRNGSHNVAYNIGGAVICVRSDVEYFDVKFPDSVQGWRKKWLYIREESSNPAEENIAPFDGETKILRRHSWDAEATEAEKLAIEALMTRIHELQNTRGKELSGIEITAYFLRIRVQPLQARKNPLWKYAGEEDVDRLSKDLPLKDFEKLIRKISSLNKKDPIPSSCRIMPYSSANPLPENHPVLASLPPLPEGGEVDDRIVVDDDNQGTSRPESEVAGSHKSAASSEKDADSEATASTHSLPPAVSPRNKRKRDDVEDSGTSKAEEAAPSNRKAAFDPYLDALVSSGDEEETPAIDATARTSTSRTLVVSEVQVEGEESSPPQQNTEQPTPPASPHVPSPKRARVESITEPALQLGGSSTPLLDDPLIKEFIRFGAQFVGYREYASKAEEKLAEANKRADTLAQKLEQSKKARKKAESDANKAKADAEKAKADAAGVEDLRKRLHDAESALSDKVTEQVAREGKILSRLESQIRRFVRRTHQEYVVDGPVGDELLDALSLLEIHGDEAREGLTDAEAGTIALIADSQQDVNWTKVGDIGQMETKKWQSLIRAAKPPSKPILLGVKPTPAPSASKPEVK